MEEKKEVQEIQEEVVRISVRNLVEFILREGDLDRVEPRIGRLCCLAGGFTERFKGRWEADIMRKCLCR